MRLVSLALAAVLVLPACGGESACERYKRIAPAADDDNLSATLEEQAEAVEALAECMAEEADPQR